MFCGIDAGIKHCICIKDDNGKILHKFFIENNIKDYEKFRKLIDKKTKICIEDSGDFSLIIYRYFKDLGYDIKRINSFKSDKLRWFMNDNVKTDLKDAEILADLRTLKDDFKLIDITQYIELKNLTRLHKFLRYYQIKIKNKLHNSLFRICPEIKSIFPSKLSKTAVSIFRQFSLEEIKNYSIKEIKEILNKNSIYSRFIYIEKIKEAIENTVGITKKKGEAFKTLINLYDNNEYSLKNIEDKITEMVYESEYKNILELPFVKSINAGTIIGEIGNIKRFSNHKQFVKFCGLDVSRKQSGRKSGKEKLGKKGNSTLRRIFYMMTLGFIGLNQDNKFKDYYNKLKAKNKHSYVCICAVSRKIAIWIYYEMSRCITNKGIIKEVINST